jgi:hypothetical protein
MRIEGLAGALIGASLCVASLGCLEPAEPGWEAFRDRSAREVDGKTIYVVEWDRAMTLDELHDYFVANTTSDGRATTTQDSTVNQVGGVDDLWTSAQAQHLTYCVTDDFPVADKARAVTEMRQATRAWEAEAHVNFEYVPAQDGHCSNTNTSVAFSVRPWTSGGACAFSPSGNGCVARTLVIDVADLDTSYSTIAPNVRTVGVFRHELGHILGLRHEQVRRPTVAGCVTEDTSWRGVTPYDQASVMHYPWCGGLLTSDLSITDSDAFSIQQLYGASFSPSALQLRVGDVDNDLRRDFIQHWRGWGSLPTCRYTSGGTFSCSNPSATLYDGGDPAQEFLAGDFNGDGRTDTIQAYRKWGSIPTCLATSGGGWSCSNPVATIYQHADDTDEQRFLVGSFDNDNRSDVIQVYRKWSTIPLCRATGTGGWSCNNAPATIYDSGSSEQQFLTGEVDGNLNGMYTDVLQTYRGWGSIPVCRADGNGGWSCSNPAATIYNSGSYEQRFATGDFNGDGKADVIQTFRGWGSIPTCLASGSFLSGFTGWVCNNAPATIYNSGSFEQQFLTGDFNGDGKTDVVQTYRGWGSLPLCLSTGTGWSCTNPPATIFNSGSREQRFIAADVDHDGKTDIIQVFRGWASYPVCFSTGTGWNCQNLPATLFNVAER